jgi:predicted metal-dependent HD superfamily phosphohydrolase
VSIRDRWRAALPATADPDKVARAGDDLIRRWSEPQRHYHTLTHLERMLEVVDAYGSHAGDPRSVALACWFHDAVYDPTCQDNEAASAELASSILPELAVDPAEVVRLVLLTATHKVTAGDLNGELITDADLAILAADQIAYQAYVTAVRAEYGFVDDEAFRHGRRAVLRQLLALPRLFHVPALHDAWEDRARANLMAELDALAAEVPPA